MVASVPAPADGSTTEKPRARCQGTPVSPVSRMTRTIRSPGSGAQTARAEQSCQSAATPASSTIARASSTARFRTGLSSDEKSYTRTARRLAKDGAARSGGVTMIARQATAATAARRDNGVMTAAFNVDAEIARYLTSRSSARQRRTRSFVSVDKFVRPELHELAVGDTNPQGIDVAGAFAFGLVHQLVGPRQQFVRELSRYVTTLADVAEEHADDADVHLRWFLGQAMVLAHPVEPLDRLTKAFGNHPGVRVVIQVGDEETEFVAAEARVQFLPASRIHIVLRRLLCDEVVRPDLLAQQAGDAIDNAVAQRMAKRVVVPLERRQVDETDGAPSAALLEREKCFQLVDESTEVHQPGLRVTMDTVGQVGDEVFEVAGDAADGG